MSEWLLNPDIAYLNHGGFGALAEPVAEAAADIRRRIERDPTDAMMRRLPGQLDAVRAEAAELIGADPAGCVFVPNATAGTATVLASLPWAAGDEIVVTDHLYPAVDRQVRRLEALGVVGRMATVGMWPSSEADVVDRVMAAVGRRTRLVVVDHVASPTGFVFPIRRLAAAAHDRGVPLLVDAAHAPGQVEVAVDADGADFWVGNLHKWVCSPRAAAVLVVTPPWRQVVRPLVASHGFFDGMQPAFDWTGTADPTPLLAVPAALRFWQDQGGWDIVRERQRGLVQAGAEAVVAAVGGRVGPEPPFAAAMRSVTLPAPLSVEAGAEVGRLLLVDHGVEAVAMSFAGQGWIRMCGQVYNEASDYDRLAAALPTVLDQVESTGSIGSRNSSRLPNGSQA